MPDLARSVASARDNDLLFRRMTTTIAWRRWLFRRSLPERNATARRAIHFVDPLMPRLINSDFADFHCIIGIYWCAFGFHARR